MHVRRVFAELDPTQSNEDNPELRAGAGRRTEYVFQEQSKIGTCMPSTSVLQ